MVSAIRSIQYYGPNGEVYKIAPGEPIYHGPHLDQDYINYMVGKITFLEDSSKQSEPLPEKMFRESEREEIIEVGRLAYAQHLRKLLADFPIG